MQKDWGIRGFNVQLQNYGMFDYIHGQNLNIILYHWFYPFLSFVYYIF